MIGYPDGLRLCFLKVTGQVMKHRILITTLALRAAIKLCIGIVVFCLLLLCTFSPLHGQDIANTPKTVSYTHLTLPTKA